MRAQRPQRAYKRRRQLHILLLSLLVFLAVLFWLWRTVSGTIKANNAVGKQVLLAWAPSAKTNSTKPEVVKTINSDLAFGKNRSFTLKPITAQESALLTQQDKSGITAAVCHRTLFGDIHLDPLFAFVSYYRLMGFDHIFFWYRANIAEIPRFQELYSLPYVTMTEYNGTGNKHGQGESEAMCLGEAKYAAKYDWALYIDADEYLWFNTPMSAKEFISRLDPKYTFVSFGKWMYSMRHAVKENVQDSGFDLDSFAFTAKSHCMRYANQQNQPRNFTFCPNFLGRCKILAKPAKHKRVHTHGMQAKLSWPYVIHFDTSVAHFKEWRRLLKKDLNFVKYHDPVSFNVSHGREIDLKHAMQGHELVDGKLTMHYLPDFRNWMRFVASGCREPLKKGQVS